MVRVVFQDQSLLVLDKPPGLVVTSTETQTEPTLEDFLKEEFKISVERGGIVHRLDKDTSGLLVVAKTSKVLENLQSQFKTRQVNKAYLALVHGQLEKEGKIATSMGRNPRSREKFVVLPEGATGSREAVTEYEPVKHLKMSDEMIEELFPDYSKIQLRKLQNMNYPLFTLVRAHPLTGRTHQIRVHLKYLGFSIVGDSKYGGRKMVRLDHRWCKRQFLHAAKISFTHPENEERLEFESKLPEDLQSALEILEGIK